jgi:hypothetical protein
MPPLSNRSGVPRLLTTSPAVCSAPKVWQVTQGKRGLVALYAAWGLAASSTVDISVAVGTFMLRLHAGGRSAKNGSRAATMHGGT